MMPVTFLMHPRDDVCTAVPHSKDTRKTQSEHAGTVNGKTVSENKESRGSASVSMLIGGHRVGGKKPLTWTDDLEGFELTPQSTATTTGTTATVPLSLHSLGIGGGRMLCVTGSTDRGSLESHVLSGPVCLFRGNGVGGVNGIVAEAMCESFKDCRMSSHIRDTSRSIPPLRNGTDRNNAVVSCIESSIVIAEILAFMLTVQEEVNTLQ